VHTAADLDRGIAPRTGERMQTIQGSLMQLQDHARPQFERSIAILDESTDHIEGEVELADAVFGLASSYLIGIAEERCRFGNAMPILRQADLPALRVELCVQVGYHFTGNAIILDMRIPVCKATPLLAKLLRGHLDFACSFNEFLQVFCHGTSPLSAIIYNLGCSCKVP
jgi:hypothetical protein